MLVQDSPEATVYPMGGQLVKAPPFRDSSLCDSFAVSLGVAERDDKVRCEREITLKRVVAAYLALIKTQLPSPIIDS